jgi:hypothetical protein
MKNKKWRVPFTRNVEEAGFYYVTARTAEEAKDKVYDGKEDDVDVVDSDTMSEEFEDAEEDD